MKFGTSRRLAKIKKADVITYTIEIFIVIFGITVAYQLNVLYEDSKDLKLEKAAIEKVRTELELNITEFDKLIDERLELIENENQLAQILYSGGYLYAEDDLENQEISKYLFAINKTYKPNLQFEGLNYYINTNYTTSNSDLKNSLLTLKNKYVALKEVAQYHTSMKEKYYNDFLIKDVDFGLQKVVNYERIKSIEFKNLILNLIENEIELNRLLEEANNIAIDIVDLNIKEKLK
ncbi:hypothetical protein AWW67_16405 [Roseivirga seohaensis]|uniref:Uncharacterized protein n=2 Tax=Roseivirga seohaensis TaxID=1914963 RepID=A0A0L8AHD8_9BACT|nr:hypothetical protein [Roseivirga seohaensis]KOF01813.1 hypothetical protein OB69_15870 [Roseivirga seohaensis subsp. aquiponti]KYG85290.1 hypothetical protein AWW67_16405 [Roseivirga seohaensis]|tara:strand:+ start:607 stop:1311 length:705 start_codon:yes stop_codon:yes gene_type:complete